MSGLQQEQLKLLVSYEHTLYFSNILPYLNEEECYQILALCGRNRRYDLLDALFSRIYELVPSGMGEIIEKGEFVLERLLSLNVCHIVQHQSSLRLLSLLDVIKFLNEVSLSENSQKKHKFMNFIS